MAFLIGLILGVVYFGGLYLIVQRITSFKHPGFIMAISFVIRMGLLLIVFYFIAQKGIKDILLALTGVILVRVIMIFKLKEPVSSSLKKG